MSTSYHYLYFFCQQLFISSRYFYYIYICAILYFIRKEGIVFWPENDSLRRGNNIEMLILSILSTEDCYGYQLSLLIKDYSQGKISLPEGSLYPALYKLVDNGLISDEKRQVGKRLTRVYYHMEPEGKDYLNQLIEEYNSLHSGIQSILNKTKEGDELTHVQKTQ